MWSLSRTPTSFIASEIWLASMVNSLKSGTRWVQAVLPAIPSTWTKDFQEVAPFSCMSSLQICSTLASRSNWSMLWKSLKTCAMDNTKWVSRRSCWIRSTSSWRTRPTSSQLFNWSITTGRTRFRGRRSRRRGRIKHRSKALQRARSKQREKAQDSAILMKRVWNLEKLMPVKAIWPWMKAC